MGCYHPLKATHLWIKCILLEINIKYEQNKTIGTRDKMILKEQKINNKEFKWSAKHIDFTHKNKIKKDIQ